MNPLGTGCAIEMEPRQSELECNRATFGQAYQVLCPLGEGDTRGSRLNSNRAAARPNPTP